MNVQVNGKARELAPGTKVSDLLDALGVNRDGVAVAVNLEVVPRSEHPSTALKAGDAVEIVIAVGGG